MSTFVLKREYALQLPNSYVDVDRDEMEYVDGGGSVSEHWWGYAINLNVSECKELKYAFKTGRNIGIVLSGIAGLANPLVGTLAGIMLGGYSQQMIDNLDYAIDRETGATLSLIKEPSGSGAYIPYVKPW
ncbi:MULTISPECIES: hypothetical protein [unclassified Clostridium]|uniref:hypothetical protein n=1 Tax=unclassified Clostridium TaxID=2614128 RepID=UPI0025C1F045|nr:hypothetical protein [Clostridium sp.]